jgi:hypothetical protein
MLQPKKPVVKKTTKKTKSASEKIGDITLRDVKNAGEDALQIATLGGYGKIKKALGSEYKYKKIGEKKYGGKVTKAKNGKSFPDLNKDGKITKADILKGRGVIAKKGATIKKAQLGGLIKKGVKAATESTVKKSIPVKKMKEVVKKVSREDLKSKMKKWDSEMKTGGKVTKAKSGTSMKKCRYGCK